MEYNESYVHFLEVWNTWAIYLALLFIVVGLLISLYYFGKQMSISDSKLKHDFINDNEIKLFWYSMLSLSIGAGLWLNTVFHETVKEEMIWFFVRLFVTASFTTIFGLIFNSLINVYYPFQVEKKLNKLRHKPRINPNNGNKMKLLGEDVEDDYLTPEMIEEEAGHSVDYDVWLDEETGYTKIEKYDGSALAIECPSCGYRTLRVEDEEVIKSPTVDSEGELLEYYKCSYCEHKERRTIVTKKLIERPKKVAEE
jgi:DNA-directed RNA polymerase subunit RPC12/RpoP